MYQVLYLQQTRNMKKWKKIYGLVCSGDATQSIHDEENTSKNYIKAKRKAKFFKRWSYKKTKYRNDGKRERKGAGKKMRTKRSKMLHRWITMERGKLEGMGMWHNAKARRIVSQKLDAFAFICVTKKKLQALLNFESKTWT